MFTVEADANRQTQDFAVIELYLDGVEDGFKGIKPTAHSWEYLKGYSNGCRHKAADLREQALRFEEEASAIERRANGELDCLDEIFQDNDEPDLIYDCVTEF